MAGTRRSTPATRSRRCAGPSSRWGPSPTAASARDALTVTRTTCSRRPRARGGRARPPREPRGDEQVEQQVAARACFAHHQVAQQPALALARERAQAQLARGLRYRVAGAVHRLRRQQAVGHVDDLSPGPALVQAQDETALFVLAEGELHLVAVAPRVVHAADGLEPVVREVRDALQRVDHLLLLVLELGGVVERLPLAPAALLRVAAARATRRGEGERSSSVLASACDGRRLTTRASTRSPGTAPRTKTTNSSRRATPCPP